MTEKPEYTELYGYTSFIAKMDVIDCNFADRHTATKARMFAHEVFDEQQLIINNLRQQLAEQKSGFNALLQDISKGIASTAQIFDAKK